MNPEYIIIHTAAHGDARHNRDTSAAEIDRWHKQNGWRGIGYHYVVRLDGTVEAGRADNERGAHCTSMAMNSRSIGICFSGHGDYHPWTAAQAKSGQELIARLMDEHDIPASHVLGHRETGANKSCPGKLIDMDAVRTALAGGAPDVPEHYDATGMFRAICAIFDDPHWAALPRDTRKLVKELRYAAPFAALTREDLV